LTLLGTDELLERQTGAVRRIIFNRPAKHNAINPAMQRALHASLEDAMEDDNTRVVILSGAGPSFSSGADHSAAALGDTEGRRRSNVKDSPMDMVSERRRVESLLHVWSMPKPLIAQVHGYCMGVANELAASSDLMVCGTSARIGAPEVRAAYALVPTLSFWPATIGLQRTKELLYTGRLVDGEEAVRLGLAVAAVPDDDLEAYVDRLAADIADVPLRTLTVAKQAVNSWWEAMGVPEAAKRGGDYHAIYHTASAYVDGEVRRLVRD
jgi:enoyl-CoA hydratase